MVKKRETYVDHAPRKITEAASTLSSLEPEAARWISTLIRVSSPHPAMTHILDVLSKMQDRPYVTNALFLGEPGTGKEGLARALHRLMNSDQPLVRLDVAGLSNRDAMAALCGYGKVSGAAEAANGGAILIEETSQIPLQVQGELLRILKTGRIRRLDSTSGTETKVRVNALALSDVDLRAEVAAGRFRHDLFFRLARLVLWLPPLRERLDDLGPAAVWMANRIFSSATLPLSAHLQSDMHDTTEQERKRIVVIGDDAIEALTKHDWFGNFRELEVTMERALLLHRHDLSVGHKEITAALAPARPRR